MRILEVIPSYLPATRYGGPIFATHALSKALVQRGHEVQVYTTFRGQDTIPSPPASKREIDGVVVNYFSADWLQRLSWAPDLARKLKEEIGHFDIIHCHSVFLWPTWSAAHLARQQEVPYIVSPRGMLVKDLIKRRSPLVKSTWIQLIEKKNITFASAVHVTSSIEAEELIRFNWRLPEVAIIPNGVEWAEPREAVSLDIQDIVHSNQPYVLFFGRLTWKKGLDTLLYAFAKTTLGFLIIAGTDDEGLSNSLHQLASELGVADRVRIIARTLVGPDRYRLFESARVFALPSISENFGNTVLEALAAGLPVIVTPEVGAAEFVVKAKAGLVVPKDPVAWAGVLERLLGDDQYAHQMGRSGRDYVVKHCSWSSVADAMEKLYQKCRSESPRPAKLPADLKTRLLGND